MHGTKVFAFSVTCFNRELIQEKFVAATLLVVNALQYYALIEGALIKKNGIF